MSVDEMINALGTLSDAQGGEKIPGLEFDKVVDGMVDAKYGEYLEEGGSESEEVRQSMLSYYKGKARQEIETKMAVMNSCYATAKVQIQALQQSIASVVASNTVPSVITAGAATSVPNPAHFMIENKQKKQSLLSAASGVIGVISTLLIHAISLAFELPKPVEVLIELATKVISLINAIPG